MIDLDLTRYSNQIERDVVAGTTVTKEGLVLKSVIVGGVEQLQVTAGGSTSEVIAGFSYNRAIEPTTEVVIEDSLTIPASPGPYTVQLLHPSLVSGSVRVHAVVANVDYTIGTPATTVYSVNLTTGLLTFAAADAGKAIIVTYRRNLTAIEVQQKYGNSPVNSADPSFFGRVVAMCGNGEIYTDQYDTSVSYDGVSALYAGANGLVTSVSTNNTLIPGSRIVSVPSATNTKLGFRFNLA